jgi:hypothetical protein
MTIPDEPTADSKAVAIPGTPDFLSSLKAEILAALLRGQDWEALAHAQEVLTHAGGEQQLRAGDRVKHPTFGPGVVVRSQMVHGMEEVTVAFEGQGLKKLAVPYANLRRA